MNKFNSFLVISSIATCLAMPDAVAQTPAEAIGALIGGVAGGVLGNQIGRGTGRTAATIGGVLLGGLFGSQIGRSYDREAQLNLHYLSQRALAEAVRTGRTVRWSGPDGFVQGVVIPRGFVSYGCRRFISHTYTVRGENYHSTGIACLRNGRLLLYR